MRRDFLSLGWANYLEGRHGQKGGKGEKQVGTKRREIRSAGLGSKE